MHPQLAPLYKAATDPFASAGRYAWHFARGKLRHDPAFFAVLKQGLLPSEGRLLDLGCGQGILMSLVLAAREQYAAGAWPEGWAAPPMMLEMHGVELREANVLAAKKALGSNVTVELGDIREASFPRSSAVVLLDVLHYLEADAQQRVLERVADSLERGGMLLMRDADASGGVSFRATQWAERIASIARGAFRQKMHYRGAGEWKRLLESLGFSVALQPMSEGTPFSNVLFVARR